MSWKLELSWHSDKFGRKKKTYTHTHTHNQKEKRTNKRGKRKCFERLLFEFPRNPWGIVRNYWIHSPCYYFALVPIYLLFTTMSKKRMVLPMHKAEFKQFKLINVCLFFFGKVHIIYSNSWCLIVKKKKERRKVPLGWLLFTLKNKKKKKIGVTLLALFTD